METKLIQIGNSKGLRLPKNYIAQFALDKGKIEIVIEKDGIKIKRSANIPPLETWEQLFKQAKVDNEIADNDIFDGVRNNNDETDWTW